MLILCDALLIVECLECILHGLQVLHEILESCTQPGHTNRCGIDPVLRQDIQQLRCSLDLSARCVELIAQNLLHVRRRLGILLEILQCFCDFLRSFGYLIFPNHRSIDLEIGNLQLPFEVLAGEHRRCENLEAEFHAILRAIMRFLSPLR